MKRGDARWHSGTATRRGQYVPAPRIDAFIEDIIAVCRKHNLWLSHEDEHGSFEVKAESTETWLRDATVDKDIVL